MSRQNGFNLIETIIVVAIVSLLAGLALPGLSGAMEASRASSAESRLLSSLTQSIQRAALTGTHTVLCPSVDGHVCTGDPDWSGGWIAFLDRDGNRERGAGEMLILVEPALSGRVRLRSTTGRARIVFQENGGNAGSNVTFTLCDGRGPSRAKTLVLNNRGGLRHGTPTASALAATCVR